MDARNLRDDKSELTREASVPPSIQSPDSLRPYDRDVTRVTAFAAILLVVSMICTGVFTFSITREQSVKKLKETDLLYIASSSADKVAGTISRAAEVSRLLATDREIGAWVEQGEPSGELGNAVKEKLARLTGQFGYDSSFIVSVPSRQYWSEQGEVLDVMTRDDPDDHWFFDLLESGQSFRYDIDRNEERNDTFVFANALMSHDDKPLAIVGVGLSLRDLSGKFEAYKYGERGSLWLSDPSGVIYLSDDLSQNGGTIHEHLPSEAAASVLGYDRQEPQALEYRTADGRVNELIAFPVPDTEWLLIVSVDREEAVAYLRTILLQTALGVAIALFSVLFFFFYTSRKLADPYKRALTLNRELERQISMRTEQLREQHGKLTDSIDYASRIVAAALPDREAMDRALPNRFLLWRPRDTVGGDFYWVKQSGEATYVAVGDCTGHGVPGALMAVLTLSLLEQLVGQDTHADPGLLLAELNRSIKHMLGQVGKHGSTDDGVEIGLCRIVGDRLLFAGAGCPLYVRRSDRLEITEGSRKAAGYRRTPSDHIYDSTELHLLPGDTIYLTTDGLLDQNGGEKNHSYGKSRWRAWIERHGDTSLAEQGALLAETFDDYRGKEQQRDDVAVLGFRLAEGGSAS